MIKERWRNLKEFPHYAVSTEGRVKCVIPFPMPHGGFAPARVLKPVADNRGYLRVLLSGKPYTSKRKFVLVHRLVLLAFCGSPKSGYNTNHKNLRKSDNRLKNLEWVTQSDNLRHAYQHERLTPTIGATGSQHWMRRNPKRIARGSQLSGKLTEHDVKRILSFPRTRGFQVSLARQYGVCIQTINFIIHRKTWKHVSHLA